MICVVVVVGFLWDYVDEKVENICFRDRRRDVVVL